MLFDIFGLYDKYHKLKEDNKLLQKAISYYQMEINKYVDGDIKYSEKLDALEEYKTKYNFLYNYLEKIKTEDNYYNKKLQNNKNEIVDNYISWDEYFMGVAEMIKSRSKDPVTKVGACIVKENRIISTGYNGFPHGCNDKKYPWGKTDIDLTKNKYYYVVHAELNAILNARQSVENSTIYVTLFPCNECAKAIIQSGIKKIIYKNMKELTDENMAKMSATIHMFHDASVEISPYISTHKTIEIEV